MKYLIVEQGCYSDYGVSIIDTTDCPLSEDEILILLKIDAWDKPSISGRIDGQIDFYDNSSISVKDIKEEAECNINNLFCCFPNRKHKTILDREYSKEELFDIAMGNDDSGESYWRECLDDKYNEYLEAYKLYLKLIANRA